MEGDPELNGEYSDIEPALCNIVLTRGAGAYEDMKTRLHLILGSEDFF